MESCVMNPSFTYANSYTKNKRENIGSSFSIKELNSTYNGFINIAIFGVSLLYNNLTGNTAMSRDQLNNLDKLYYMKKLEKDWNGYGAEEINKEAINKCEIIIKNICHQPIIFPTGRSSIHMQFELEDKSYLEIEVFEKKIVCMEVPQRVYEKAKFKVFTELNIEKINQIVKEFYER